MSDKERDRDWLNLQVLQRIDGKITGIIGKAGHVSVYSFIKDQKTWMKSEVEGSLFIVQRSTNPLFQLIVMNRVNAHNMVETITPEFQIQISEPYLIFRTSNHHVFGLWFFNPDERELVSIALHK